MSDERCIRFGNPFDSILLAVCDKEEEEEEENTTYYCEIYMMIDGIEEGDDAV